MAQDANLALGGKTRSAYRWIAGAACAALILGLLLSALFLVTHHRHDHDHDAPGGGCTVCAQLTVAEEQIRRLSLALSVAALALCCTAAAHIAPLLARGRTGAFTPVRLKVKLNN